MSKLIEYSEPLPLNPQSYGSINEFKSFHELPETKPLALVNLNGEIAYENHSFQELFFLEIGDNFSKLNSEPNLQIIIDNLAKSKYSSFHFDFMYFTDERLDLKRYNSDVDRVLVGEDEYFVLVFTSYEEKKLIEERINNLHNALEYGNVSVIITDENGVINYSSKSFEDILNTNIEELYNKYLPDVFSSYLSETNMHELKNALYTHSQWIKLISDVDDDGEVRFLEVRLNPVKRTDTSKTNFIVTTHDITNYVLKNRIIEKSERHQKTIINNITDPLIIIRREKNKLKFENANESFYSVFGIVKEGSLEKKLFASIPGDLHGSILKAVEESDGNSKEFIEFRYSNKRNEREYLGKLSFVDDLYDDFRLYIINLSDVTEQLRSQEQLRIAFEKENQLNKLKSAFLANMSHEIRTPLNAIVGYSELLEDDVEEGNTESVKLISQYMRDGVKRILNLVDNIIEVSILQSGDENLEFEVFPINALIKTIYRDSVQRATSALIDLSFELEDGSSYIRVDEDKFRKVMEMLVDNSIKYNRENGSVIIKSRRIGKEVAIDVIDTGIGIEKGKLDQILEPFTQMEDEGYRRSYEGAGLGLTIAYRLTLLLKGKFNISSIPNKGTTITLIFPSANPA